MNYNEKKTEKGKAEGRNDKVGTVAPTHGGCCFDGMNDSLKKA